MNEKLISKEVEIPLDEHKVHELAQQAAGIRAETDVVILELEELTKAFKEEQRKKNEFIKQKEDRISELLRDVKSGKTKSTEKVIMQIDLDAGTVSYLWPHDAPKEKQIVVEQRAMTSDEHQLKLVDGEQTAVFQEADAQAIPQE